MSVGINTGLGQGSSSGYGTGNPQQIGSTPLQPTQQLQGSSSNSGVLGLSDVLSQPNTTKLEVETSNTSSSTSQPTETTPVQPTTFNVPGIVLFLGALVLIFGVISFVWSQRNSAQ